MLKAFTWERKAEVISLTFTLVYLLPVKSASPQCLVSQMFKTITSGELRTYRCIQRVVLICSHGSE